MLDPSGGALGLVIYRASDIPDSLLEKMSISLFRILFPFVSIISNAELVLVSETRGTRSDSKDIATSAMKSPIQDAVPNGAPEPEITVPIVEGAEVRPAWYRELKIGWPSYGHLEWYEHPAFKIGVLLGCMAIIFGIYFGALDPIRIDREQFTSATCVSLKRSNDLAIKSGAF